MEGSPGKWDRGVVGVGQGAKWFMCDMRVVTAIDRHVIGGDRVPMFGPVAGGKGGRPYASEGRWCWGGGGVGGVAGSENVMQGGGQVG